MPTIFYRQRETFKKGQIYYTQIQLQLFVFNMDKCELVVWTPNWLYNTAVHRDITFINSMLDELKEFSAKNIFPELLTRKLEQGLERPRPLPDNRLYCI